MAFLHLLTMILLAATTAAAAADSAQAIPFSFHSGVSADGQCASPAVHESSVDVSADPIPNLACQPISPPAFCFSARAPAEQSPDRFCTVRLWSSGADCKGDVPTTELLDGKPVTRKVDGPHGWASYELECLRRVKILSGQPQTAQKTPHWPVPMA